MGADVGAAVGITVGSAVGAYVGSIDTGTFRLGCFSVGDRVGGTESLHTKPLGCSVLGAYVGATVGLSVGATVGAYVGPAVGA